LTLRKSRARTFTVHDQGGFRIIDRNYNWLVAGENFDLTLEDVERFLRESAV
jgi:hypothetical protein